LLKVRISYNTRLRSINNPRLVVITPSQMGIQGKVPLSPPPRLNMVKIGPNPVEPGTIVGLTGTVEG